ncbi:polar amino acid transport system permease protein [Natranaerovirga hydrolytica]|uniref:Polar amino acid transport system permease protein n=1 Tax=Natranaerovirga hydrolytica TaxID=680378 RepID=A0A4R1N1G9_9FIRM|nr:amino acid ABC transporter permease [Natranaerovirga hydrolytica]TCK97844.1 polar amino acid transport system permease protein [Natranaerovirga hydrolytica]
MYDFSIIFDDFHIFIPAAIETLKISAASIVFGVVVGLIIALFKISKFKLLNIPASIYIGVIRGTPILLQLLLLFYGLTNIIRLNAFPAAVIAFGVHNSAYIAEIFRGSILSVDIGQREAARSIGMTKTQAFRRVIFPQAFKRAVPPLGNQFIIAIKDSSLASAVAVRELLMQARQLGSATYHPLEYLMIAGIYYLIITLSLSYVVKKVEKRLAVSDRGRS